MLLQIIFSRWLLLLPRQWSTSCEVWTSLPVQSTNYYALQPPITMQPAACFMVSWWRWCISDYVRWGEDVEDSLKLLMMLMLWKKMTNYLVIFHRHNMPKNDTWQKKASWTWSADKVYPTWCFTQTREWTYFLQEFTQWWSWWKYIAIMIGRVPAPTLMMNHLPHASVQA